MKDGLVRPYNSLAEDLKVDVAIIGAGISAALTAYYIRNLGMSVAVFDRRHVGMGSTAASTAFLQYEIDTPLRKLKDYVGINDAVKSYELCRKAIYDIKDLCMTMKPKFDFNIRPSLQYASYKKDMEGLKEEYELRKKYKFDVQWLSDKEVKTMFGFDAPGAIFSKDGGEVDAYLLTHELLNEFCKAGHKVYNNTNVEEITHHKNGVMLTTSKGYIVKAKKLVIAAGYESLRYLPKKIADIHSTYAMVSEPIHEKHVWHKQSLVWETANPYLYFRIVNDDRVLIGGKDDMFHNPEIRNERIRRKTKMLLHSFSERMKHIPVKPDFSWAGAFAVTKDGLPYIGQIPERPHTYFALGFGGNGITFSVIAAEMICDMLKGKNNKDTEIFRFNR